MNELRYSQLIVMYNVDQMPVTHREFKILIDLIELCESFIFNQQWPLLGLGMFVHGLESPGGTSPLSCGLKNGEDTATFAFDFTPELVVLICFIILPLLLPCSKGRPAEAARMTNKETTTSLTIRRVLFFNLHIGLMRQQNRKGSDFATIYR